MFCIVAKKKKLKYSGIKKILYCKKSNRIKYYYPDVPSLVSKAVEQNQCWE